MATNPEAVSEPRRSPGPAPRWAAYMGVSVSVYPDGTWRAHLTRKNLADGHVQTFWLDGGDGGSPSTGWMLDGLHTALVGLAEQYWQEGVLPS